MGILRCAQNDRKMEPDPYGRRVEDLALGKHLPLPMGEVPPHGGGEGKLARRVAADNSCIVRLLPPAMLRIFFWAVYRQPFFWYNKV